MKYNFKLKLAPTCAGQSAYEGQGAYAGQLGNEEPLKKTKTSNDKYFREYYELGCLCVLTNKIEKFEGEDDAEAVEFYEKNCQCSRHTNSANRKCWDSLLTPKEHRKLVNSLN